MREPLPTVLIPGLLCTPRLYAEQIPALWRFGPVTVANHTHDDSMGGIARRILSQAPPQFALVGLSMGGYVAFEMLRQAPDRVAKLALLDTTARPDAPEQTEQRKRQIEMARTGRFDGIAQLLFPRFVAAARHGDRALQAHRADDGRGHRRRSVRPPANGDHESRRLAAGARGHRLPDARRRRRATMR